jgi:hypothetical protein
VADLAAFAALMVRARSAIGHQPPQLVSVFCNSDLDKSTIVCKMGDLEVFSKAFLDLYTSIKYRSMRCTPVRCTFMRCTPMRYTPSEMHTVEVHAYDVYTHEVHTLRGVRP